MSPPSKAAPELDRDQRPEGTDRAAQARSRSAADTLAPPHATVIAAQQTAGNQAVAALLGGSSRVQRAPKDDDPRRTSGMAHGPTLDSSGGVATAPTLPPAQRTDDPRRTSGMAHGPTLDSSGGVATAPTVPADAGAVGPAGTPLSGPPTIQSQEDEGDFPDPPPPRRGKHPENIKPAMPATRAEAEEAYRRDPRLVHRSTNESLHGQYWRIDPGTAGGAPRIYRSGKTFIIAPDLVGPGLPPPHAQPIEADEGAESEGIRALGEHLDSRRQTGATRAGPATSPDDAGARALFPGSRRGPEPGMKPAEAVSHDEVMKAYRADPASVHPSTDEEWHRQVYDLDRGKGPLPRAYRSGDRIIVDPSYPLDGSVPGAARTAPAAGSVAGADLASVLDPAHIPSDPAKRAEMLRDPDRGPQLRDAINARNDREREEHMARARAGTAAKQDASKVERPIPRAMSTIAPAPIGPEPESDIPRDQTVRYDDDSPDIEIDVPEEKKPAKWGMKGGRVTRESTAESSRIRRGSTDTTSRTNTVDVGLTGGGYESKRRQETRTGDTVTATERSTKVKAGFKGVGIDVGRTSQAGKGDAAGPNARKTTTTVNAGANLGPGGLGGKGTAAIESKTGAKAEATGGVNIDPKGNLTADATFGATNAKGFGAHVTFHGGISVEASEPVLVDGEYQVSYTITRTSGAGVGGGWSKPGGGMSASLNVGSSSSSGETGTRRFKDEGQAKLFRLTAALQLDRERGSAKKVTTADGALAIPIGETRGSTQSDTDTVGGSFAMEGADVGMSKTDTTTRGLTVKRVSETKVQVTPDVSATHGTDASIGAWGAFGNTTGSSETNAFAVTYEFDIGTDAGKKAYEQYCRTRMPPPPSAGRQVRTDEGHSGEDHDVYKFSGVGTVGYQDSAFQQKVVDEQGTHERAGGGQSHKVDLNWVRHLTFDENVHSETQIVANLEDGKQAGLAGQMTVGGESGEYNREQFGKIFMGAQAKPGTKVSNSGEWTLGADISVEAFRDLDRIHPELQKAKTQQEKIKVYGELAKKHGASMLSGQVRSGGKALAWNLELKGDPNFPGAAGRARLVDLRAKLAEQLKSKPSSAGSVASEAKDTLASLNKRLAAVSDESMYTDLPDELRGEQVALIKDHIAQFTSLRSQALSLSMRGDSAETVDDVRARAGKAHGYDEVKPDHREITKLRDGVALKEADISRISNEIQAAYKILSRMMNDRSVRVEEGVRYQVGAEHTSKAKAALGQARSMDVRLRASAQKARELRDQWANGTDPQANLTNVRALDAELTEQRRIVELELEFVRDATREAYIVTTDEAIGRDWAYFQSIKADGAARAIAISGFEEE